MIRTFNDLYAHELEMLVSAETQMEAILPELATGADTEELQEALLAQVKGCTESLNTLGQLLEGLHRPHKVLVSRAMQSLLGECTELLKSFPEGNLRDAVLIAHLQRAEHYKMAAYESVQQFAMLIGDKDGAESLSQAGRAVVVTQRTLRSIAVQVNAERMSTRGWRAPENAPEAERVP